MKNIKNITPRVGIDFGKVIISPIKGGKSDTAFLSGNLSCAMQTPPGAGAFAGVRALVDLFAGQAWVVSKAGPSVQQKSTQWMRHWNFHEETGLPFNHLRFCRRRSEKAEHCTQLGITHFIDDRLDVLRHLRGVVPHLYLFGEQPRLNQVPDWVTPISEWSETRSHIIKDLPQLEYNNG